VLLELCQRIYDASWSTALRESQYMFPLVESLHVLSLGASVGLVLWIDLRFIGVALGRRPPGVVIGALRVPMLAGFGLMALTGVMLFCSEAVRLYPSVPFRTKLLLLGVAGLNALAFEWRERTRGRVASSAGAVPGYARTAGWVSLLCWIGVIALGRWTAYGL
jgi:hypothetical protein